MDVLTAVSFSIAINLAGAAAEELELSKTDVKIEVRDTPAGVKFIIWRLVRAEVEKVELIASATSLTRLMDVAYAFLVHKPLTE